MSKRSRKRAGRRSVTPRHAGAAKGQRVLRLPAVMDRTGLSRSTIYRKLGHLRVPLGENSAGWLESDVAGWIAERVAERDAAAAE